MRRDLALGAAVVAATLLFYVRIQGHTFVLCDDQHNIYANPWLAPDAPGGVARFWTEPYGGLWIPLTYTVWAGLTAVSGQVEAPGLHDGPTVSPAAFHLAGVALHTVAAGLVFRILLLVLGGGVAAAALGAMLFALHPLQVEPVAWATGLKDVLSGTLVLGSCLAWLRFVARGGVGSYAVASAMFVLAVLAKPQAVVTPLLAAVLARAAHPGLPARRTWLPLAPWLAAAAAAALVTIRAQGGEDPVFPIPDVAPWQRPIVALDALGFYLAKAVWPSGLSLDYGRTPGVVLSSWASRPLWLLPLAVAGALALARRARLARAGAAFAVVALLPVLGLVPFGFQATSTVGDRYVYLALAGVALAVAAGVRAARSPAVTAVAAVCVTALAAQGQRQLSVWATNDALLAHVADVNPRSVIAVYNQGLSASFAGRYDEALERYERTMELRPDFYFAPNNIGVIHNMRREFADAVPWFRKALELRPEAPDALLNLSIALRNLGRHEEAVEVLRELVRVQPEPLRAHLDLATSLHALGRADEAMEAFRHAAATHPDDPLAHRMLGIALFEAGRVDEAREEAARALEAARADPDFPAQLLAQLEQEAARYGS